MQRVRTLWFVGLSVALLSGCLTKARTPYNEVALFSEDAPAVQNKASDPQELATPPGKTINLWPLYIGDGRAHYFAWPLIKKSPGCFALLPLYNYDHGIHDIALICTLSPESGEYRLWPIFYRSPKWWMLLPFAYAYNGGYGSPFLFNANDHFKSVLTFFWSDDNWALFPLALYASGSGDDYGFYSLLYSQELDTYGDTTERNHYALINLFGSEILTNSKENWRRVSQWLFPLWFRGYYDPKGEGKRYWYHLGVPLYWSWGRETGETPDANHLFIPFYYKRSFGEGGATLCTPLVGYGKTPQQDAAWWYFLNVGAAESDIVRERWGGNVYDEKGERLRSWNQQTRVHERSAWALPFWFSSENVGKRKTDWTPFSYAARTTEATELNVGPLGLGFPFSMERSAGREETFVFPVTHEKTWHTTSARTGEAERVAPNTDEWRVLGGVLWSKERCSRLPSGVQPVDLVEPRTQTESTAWKMPLLRLGVKDETEWYENRVTEEEAWRGYGLLTTYEKARYWHGETCYCGKHSKNSTPELSSWRHERGYSALLSSCDEVAYTDYERPSRSYESIDRGFLLNSIHWGSTTRGGRNFSLCWDFLTRYERDVWGCDWQMSSVDYELLPWGMLLDVRQADDTLSTYADTELLWGLLYDYDRDTYHLRTASCWRAEHAKKCTKQDCYATHHDVNCRETTRSFHLEHDLLLGILWNHTIRDRQEWHTHKDVEHPELTQPTEEHYYNEARALFGLTYVCKTQRDGSYVAKSLWGLLYDHTEKMADNTETLGILGYLYRYNRYADGSTSRTVFPFISYEDNVPEETTSVSFLYKLFRHEKTPEGRNIWLFWIPVW